MSPQNRNTEASPEARAGEPEGTQEAAPPAGGLSLGEALRLVDWNRSLREALALLRRGLQAIVPPLKRAMTLAGTQAYRGMRAVAARWPDRPLAWRAGQALGSLVFLTALGIGIFTWRAPDLAALWAVEREPSFTILDAGGGILAVRGRLYGEDIEVEDLPPQLIQAFLAIEDNRFYAHSGFDVRGILRAAFANITAGRWAHGGSTISQQLAKNLFLSHERTLFRKFAEIVHTIRLERHLTKDQILSLYLNRIYLGAGTYGVDAAAHFYFGKSAREVTLAEAAMLASLPKAPSRYAPTADLDLARRRAELVLANMAKAGYITADEERAARDKPAVPVNRPGSDNIGFIADEAVREARTLLGGVETDLVIETAIDQDLQSAAEDAVAAVMDEKGAPARAGEAALVMFTPDGALRALVGGRSYVRSQFNRATQARRQPGSAFKPFVFLAAIEHGYFPDDPVDDRPVRVGNWKPENYDGRYRGRITVSQALEQSVNTVAVRLSEDVGRENVIKAARRTGIRSAVPDHPSIALGTSEVTLYELTGAYLTFANNGITAAPHMIVRIRTKSGEEVYAHEAAPHARVIDPQVSATMTRMLQRTVQYGTGRNAGLGRHPAAGKTGTSQDNRDAWFIGYSAHYVAGVWVGNDDDTPMAGVTGADLPSEIWRRAMTAAHRDRPVAALPGSHWAERRRRGRVGRFFRRLGRDLGIIRDRGR